MRMNAPISTLCLWLAGSTIAGANPKTIVDLQPFRQSVSIRIRSKAGADGTATLINLNPKVNSWYLLEVAWRGARQQPAAYHLENADPRARRILLQEQYPAGVVIADGNRQVYCDLFSSGVLEQARASSLVFHPLCDARIYLRNSVTGHRSNLEAGVEFLRDHVWGGEKIIGLGHILMGERNRETGELKDGIPDKRSSANLAELPRPALINPECADRVLKSNNLGIPLAAAGTAMTPGAWYPAADNPGIYVSLLQPNLIDPQILQTYKALVNPLDGVEASALVYLVAFDLDRFDLGFALGTTHPAVGWSDRTLASVKDPALPGPDGVAGIKPLIATGMAPPEDTGRTVATFAGGFKRNHGAFKYGELALKNHGSHYGFIENGVVFSKLQPGLATIFMLDDGAVEMKTWTEGDNLNLATIKFARQNGVPLIEFSVASKTSAPGGLVNKWGAGNWSGSEQEKLRTMRAGAALQRNGRKRFLIYAVFSDATPSAMARVFQAYGCDYAMLLDMNALEYTYLAVYRRAGSQLIVDHLLKGMSVLEKSSGGEVIPRFLGYPDNRDFFYVMRR